MSTTTVADRPRGHEDPDPGVEGNARLTATTGAVLFGLLAVEGLTVLSVHSMLRLHVFVGTLLVGPVLVKLGSTGWRFVRYYRRDPAYRRKGPPPLYLRLLGPVIGLLTIVLLASGIVAVLTTKAHSLVLFVHKASFVLWFGATTIHVLGHGVETARTAGRDWAPATAPRGDVSRRAVWGRRALVVASIVAGALLGALVLHVALPGLGGAHQGAPR